MAAHPWLIVIVVNKILPLWMGFFYAFSVTFLRKNPIGLWPQGLYES